MVKKKIECGKILLCSQRKKEEKEKYFRSQKKELNEDVLMMELQTLQLI